MKDTYAQSRERADDAMSQVPEDRVLRHITVSISGDGTFAVRRMNQKGQSLGNSFGHKTADDAIKAARVDRLGKDYLDD